MEPTQATVFTCSNMSDGSGRPAAMIRVAHLGRMPVARNVPSVFPSPRVPVRSKDELGQMAKAFNTMLDRITRLVQSEAERKAMQKRTMEFLAKQLK